MEYTVDKFARLAGVSKRTLHYYDEIGLLRPARVNSSGYRIYGRAEVDRLQQILFYRELGFSLETVRQVLDDPAFETAKALEGHLLALRAQRSRLDLLIQNATQTLTSIQGGTTMQDQDKFTGFKKQLIEENEEKYGAEVRERYGNETIDASNAKLMGMTEEQHKALTALSERLNQQLAEAVQQGDPASPLAQEAAALHKEWLCFFWPSYSTEAHRGLGQMYVDDPRFTAYYDKITPGAAVFLRDAINIYCDAQDAK